MSVQRLRPEAEETDQCVLPNMQEANQRCNQNISAMMGPDVGAGATSSAAICQPCPILRLGWTQILAPAGESPKPGHNCAYFVNPLWRKTWLFKAERRCCSS